MTLAERFGANLKAERRRAGYSQELLGVRAGLHRTEIGLLERGERLPRIDTLVKLVGALGVGADALLDGIAWCPPEVRRGKFEELVGND